MKTDNFQRLPEVFSKNGNNYRLYKRGSHAIIYAIVGTEGQDLDYEVFRIRIRPAGTQFGKFYPATEMFPPSEAFGRWAWWCNSLEKALEYFDRLEVGLKCGRQTARECNGGEDLPSEGLEYCSDHKN